ncbi:MAG: hypothetical protein H0W24_03445 [Lysobacter sp.]|nr:hypothetical protein [Lysobacter sp.]MDQ3268625.1 hypothetical protein [Pseudomonadota bacterium]
MNVLATIRKVSINYGYRALSVLGPAGFLRYAFASVRDMPGILAERNLVPVDRSMSGVMRLNHPVSGSRCLVDLDAYRAGDMEEGSFAFGLLREIWFRNIYFRHFDMPSRLGCVIDLGANRGIFALQAAAIAEQVIAVEALDKYRTSFQRNLDLNGLANVELIQAMVGGSAFLQTEGQHMLGLGELIARACAPVDFLKVDIEGSEFELDWSAAADVKRIAMEMHPRWGSPADLVSKVAALGFDCRTYDESMRSTPAAGADFLLAVNGRYPEARFARPAADLFGTTSRK